MPKITPHKDDSLNYLRLLALGVAGIYLFKSYKKEGTLLGATGKDEPLDFNTDKLVEGISPFINVPHDQKERVMNDLKCFAHHFKEQVLRWKNEAEN